MAPLEDLNVQVHHVFSCERIAKLRDFIASRFSPATIYPDMQKRDNEVHRPSEVDLDFYVAGLACQPFSIAGKNRGMADAADGGRGCLFVHAVDFITNRLPRVFLLENVENMIKQHFDDFQRLGGRPP